MKDSFLQTSENILIESYFFYLVEKFMVCTKRTYQKSFFNRIIYHIGRIWNKSRIRKMMIMENDSYLLAGSTLIRQITKVVYYSSDNIIIFSKSGVLGYMFASFIRNIILRPWYAFWLMIISAISVNLVIWIILGGFNLSGFFVRLFILALAAKMLVYQRV